MTGSPETPTLFRITDLETSGTGPNDAVVEIGVVDLVGGETIIVGSDLVRPPVPVSPEASAIHQIVDDDVSQCMDDCEKLKCSRVFEAWVRSVPYTYRSRFFRHECRSVRTSLLNDVLASTEIPFQVPYEPQIQGTRAQGQLPKIGRVRITSKNCIRLGTTLALY